MCYRKVRLKNRVRDDHKSGFDKVYIKAPCGCCPSCRKVKSNDWLVRSYYEFLGNHRQALFLSLDFDNEHLPYYKGTPCFDSEIMKHFLKRLRNHIGKFRYMYATDYGGLLHRPHYHMILLPDKVFTLEYIVREVKSTWLQGHCTNIEAMDSIDNNKLKAMQYVVSYTTKDIAFHLDDDVKDMPLRFRPRVQASKGFGYRALEEGIITVDDIVNCRKVSIPIGKNGKLVSFPIPRYYEMKVCYDYSWLVDQKKADLKKNEFGVMLSKNRYNHHYIHLIKSFFASRHFYMPSIPDIDLSYFGTQLWRQVVYDCCSNMDDFSEFVYYRPFIDFQGSSLVRDNIRNELLFKPAWSYYEAALQVFEAFEKHFNDVKDKMETEVMLNNAKYKARLRIARDPELRSYLRRKHFDFNLLN